MRTDWIAATLALVLVVSTVAAADVVTQKEKQSFIRLLAKLPNEGEFLTEASVGKAAPYTRVLFALSESDIEGYDLYPFLALSRGLCDREKYRRFAVEHFTEIVHPAIQMGWAVMLFNANVASPEILKYLVAALENEQRREELAEFVGPDFTKFRDRVYQSSKAK